MAPPPPSTDGPSTSYVNTGIGTQVSTTASPLAHGSLPAVGQQVVDKSSPENFPLPRVPASHSSADDLELESLEGDNREGGDNHNGGILRICTRIPNQRVTTMNLCLRMNWSGMRNGILLLAVLRPPLCSSFPLISQFMKKLSI